MEFYSPVQKRKPRTEFTSGPAYQGGSAPNLSQRRIGYLDTEMLGSDQWGTGASFQGAVRPAMIDALKATFSNANPEDYAAMDELRDLYRSQVADVPTLENMGRSNLDTSMQRGLSNLLRQHRSSAAGSGRLGSRQFAGQAGDITSRIASEYNQGLLGLRNAGIAQGAQLGQSLNSLQSRDLAERVFQNQQSQSLSSLLERMSARDQGREEKLNQQQIDRENADKEMWGKIISAGMGAAGMMAGGPAGGMAGAQLGQSVMGPQVANTGALYGGGNGGYSVGSSYGMYDPSRWNGGYYGG